VAIQADPASTGKEMLVVYGTPGSDSIVLAGTGSGVSLAFDGTALGNIAPTNGSPFALVMAFGGGNDTLDARNRLSNGGGLNGSYVLGGTTVFDDNTTDLLYGGAGLDWYFAHTKGKNTDKVYNLTNGEVVTGI
jgi:hypothetical protein